jgi:hypothetical protein
VRVRECVCVPLTHTHTHTHTHVMYLSVACAGEELVLWDCVLRCHECRDAALEDASLVEGNALQVMPEDLRVLQPQRRHPARVGPRDHVGRVEAAAYPHLHHCHVHPLGLEHLQRRGNARVVSNTAHTHTHTHTHTCTP